MGELSGVPIGIITQLAAGNPIATFAMGMLSVLIVLGVAVRLWNNSRRSDKLDKASDGYRDALTKRVEVLETQIALLQNERVLLVGKLATAEASLNGMQQRLAGVETENMRLRDENAGQELRLRQSDIDARAAQGKIAALERQVRDLEARQVRSESGDPDGNI